MLKIQMLTPAGVSTSCKFKHFFSFLLLMNLIYIGNKQKERPAEGRSNHIRHRIGNYLT